MALKNCQEPGYLGNAGRLSSWLVFCFVIPTPRHVTNAGGLPCGLQNGQYRRPEELNLISSSLELTRHSAQFSAVRGQITRRTQLRTQLKGQQTQDGASRVLTALICREVESGEARQAYAFQARGATRQRGRGERRVSSTTSLPSSPSISSRCSTFRVMQRCDPETSAQNSRDGVGSMECVQTHLWIERPVSHRQIQRCHHDQRRYERRGAVLHMPN